MQSNKKPFCACKRYRKNLQNISSYLQFCHIWPKFSNEWSLIKRNVKMWNPNIQNVWDRQLKLKYCIKCWRLRNKNYSIYSLIVICESNKTTNAQNGIVSPNTLSKLFFFYNQLTLYNHMQKSHKWDGVEQTYKNNKCWRELVKEFCWKYEDDRKKNVNDCNNFTTSSMFLFCYYMISQS